MTRSEAVARILEEIGFRPPGSPLDDLIVRRLQEAQRDLESGKTLPLFLLQENSSLLLLTGAHRVNLPNDFIREDPDLLLHYFPLNSDVPVFLERRIWMDAMVAQLTFANEPNQAPQVYVIRKSSVDFITDADRDYTF